MVSSAYAGRMMLVLLRERLVNHCPAALGKAPEHCVCVEAEGALGEAKNSDEAWYSEWDARFI